jgi:hypothetical protein
MRAFVINLPAAGGNRAINERCVRAPDQVGYDERYPDDRAAVS